MSDFPAPQPPTDRAVLTLAVGNPVYTRYAVNLARSFVYWNKGCGIRFVVATDTPAQIPLDLAGIEVLELRPGQYGQGFSPKLHLDRIAPAAYTLFIDADSLCVGPIADLFERFAGRAVGVIGNTISRGEWFGDVAAACLRFGVPALPKFNGGVYYLESGPVSRAVFTMARSLESSYDEIGLVRLRGRPNDEILLAIAMAAHGQGGITEDGTLMAEPLNFACGLRVDVLGGKATLRNTPGHPRYQPHWPLTEAHPRLVHFLGDSTDRPPYTAEALRLEKVMAAGWPAWTARWYSNLLCTAPAAMAARFKKIFRPAYRALFGPRAVPLSNRV